MADGLFLPQFRGPGSPGAPGVGSTRRGLETARQAEQLTQTQQIGLQATSDEARLQSLIRGAVLLKQIRGPQQKIEFLQGRIQQLEANGIDSSDTRQALALAQAGDFAALEELTDQAISLGQAEEKQAPFQFKEGGIIFNPNTGKTTVDPVAKQRIDNIAARANVTGKLDFKGRQSMNKDVTGLLKNTVGIVNTAKDIGKLGRLGGGPASIALVFKFMKALDPTSVVREGEFATAQNSAGIPEGIRNIFNKLLTGERLGEAQIKQFVDTVQALANTAIGGSTEEINKLLNTFGDTLPDDFKKSLLNRIPGGFEVDQKPPASIAKPEDQSIFARTPIAETTPPAVSGELPPTTPPALTTPPAATSEAPQIPVSPEIQALLDKHLGNQ